jgi:hypothetical protein
MMRWRTNEHHRAEGEALSNAISQYERRQKHKCDTLLSWQTKDFQFYYEYTSGIGTGHGMAKKR